MSRRSPGTRRAHRAPRNPASSSSIRLAEGPSAATPKLRICPARAGSATVIFPCFHRAASRAVIEARSGRFSSTTASTRACCLLDRRQMPNTPSATWSSQPMRPDMIDAIRAVVTSKRDRSTQLGASSTEGTPKALQATSTSGPRLSARSSGRFGAPALPARRGPRPD